MENGGRIHFEMQAGSMKMKNNGMGKFITNMFKAFIVTLIILIIGILACIITCNI